VCAQARAERDREEYEDGRIEIGYVSAVRNCAGTLWGIFFRDSRPSQDEPRCQIEFRFHLIGSRVIVMKSDVVRKKHDRRVRVLMQIFDETH